LHCKWRLCAASQEELRSPVVACELGRLFNKESILEMLLDKSKAPECAEHIRNLKDVKELVLTANAAFKKNANKGDGAYDDSKQMAQYVCPVLGVEMNGKFRFCFIWTCGCVMSERALKEIKTTVCHKVSLLIKYCGKMKVNT
jgi:Rtf2 RING-finger